MVSRKVKRLDWNWVFKVPLEFWNWFLNQLLGFGTRFGIPSGGFGNLTCYLVKTSRLLNSGQNQFPKAVFNLVNWSRLLFQGWRT